MLLEVLLSQLLDLQKKRLILLQIILTCSTLIFGDSQVLWKIRRMGKRKLRSRRQTFPRSQTSQKKRKTSNWSRLRIFDRTGVFEDNFVQLYNRTEAALLLPRTGTQLMKRILDPVARLVIGLQFLRENLKFKILGKIYKISERTARREVYFVLPIIFVEMQTRIRWPLSFSSNPFYGVCGAIDCTFHLRTRVHPGSLEYYRGDLKDYFIISQLITSLQGHLWSVILRKGHHNDQGVLNHTDTGDLLHQLGIYLLGDLGYHHLRIIAPRDVNENESLRHRQLRAVVERMNGYVKCWAFASGRCRLTPEWQELGLMIIYNLVAEFIQENPLT